MSPLVVCILDEELVGTGAAFEAVLALGVGIGRGGAGDCEDVGAGGADWQERGVLVGGVVDGQEGKRGGVYRGALWWFMDLD